MAKKRLRKSEQNSDRNELNKSQSASVNPYLDYTSTYTVRPKFIWRPFVLAIAILLVAIVICFANTLAFGTVFNDKATFALLQVSDPEKFFSEQWVRALAQPLSQPWLRSSFVLDFANYGGTFGWYHLVNLFLHLSSVIALFCLVLRVSWRLRNDEQSQLDPWKVAGASALIYACHPLVVQSASYITGRYMPLAAANYLIALNTFLIGLFGKSRVATAWGYGLTLIFGYMALISNEVALSLPLMMLALFFIVKPKDLRFDLWAVDHPLVCGILAALSLSFPFLYFTGFSPGYAANTYGLPKLSTAAYTATQAKALFTYYIRCFCVPLGLSIDPPYATASGWGDLLAVAGAAVLGGFAFLAINMRNNPIVMLGLALFFAGYIPHFCIVQPESVADPVFYLSLAGLATLVGWGLTEIFPGDYRQFATKCAPILAGLVVLSIVRNLDWSSDERLFSSAKSTNQTSVIALSWMADSALAKHEYGQTLKYVDEALASNPQAAIAWLIKANALVGQEEYSQAAAAFKRADDLAAKQKLSIESVVKLARAENDLRIKKLTEAEQLIYKSIALDPNNQRAIYVMGLLELSRGGYDKAFMFLRKAAEQRNGDSLAPLTECAIRLGHYDQSLQAAEAAVRYKDSPESQYALGIAHYANGQYKPAEQAFLKVLKSMPRDARSLAFLSLIADQRGEKSVAESYRNDALKIDPSVFSNLPAPKAQANVVPSASPAKSGSGAVGSADTAKNGVSNKKNEVQSKSGAGHHIRRHH